jgi:hypothetical protein
MFLVTLMGVLRCSRPWPHESTRGEGSYPVHLEDDIPSKSSCVLLTSAVSLPVRVLASSKPTYLLRRPRLPRQSPHHLYGISWHACTTHLPGEIISCSIRLSFHISFSSFVHPPKILHDSCRSAGQSSSELYTTGC